MRNALQSRLMYIVLGVLLALGGSGYAGTVVPDTLYYTVQSGDTLIKICSLHRAQTGHYSLDDLLADIRQANQLDSNFLRIGQRLCIPCASESPASRVSQRVAAGAEIRGIDDGAGLRRQFGPETRRRFHRRRREYCRLRRQGHRRCRFLLQPPSVGELGRRSLGAGHLVAGGHDAALSTARIVRDRARGTVSGR